MCNRRYNGKGSWIGCDGECQNWYHFNCVGLSVTDEPPKGVVPSVVQLLTNTQLLLWWLCLSCTIKLSWTKHISLFQMVVWNHSVASLWNVDTLLFHEMDRFFGSNSTWTVQNSPAITRPLTCLSSKLDCLPLVFDSSVNPRPFWLHEEGRVSHVARRVWDPD